MMKKRKTGFIAFIYILFVAFNSYAGAVEQFMISSQLKEDILRSPFKANLKTHDGRQFVAYLYAQDEESDEMEPSSCITGDTYHTTSKIGHFYIYLYNVSNKSFSNYRTKIFHDFSRHRFNDEGANIFVLSGSNVNKSDVLLISQFGACSGDFYEAYGFSENNFYLKNYLFFTFKQHEQFYGRVSVIDTNDKLYAYSPANKGLGELDEMYLSVSKEKNGVKIELIEQE